MGDCRMEPGSIPEVRLFLTVTKSMRKGCKLYAILALNEKGVAEGLEHLPVVKEFADVFPEELPGMPPKENWSLP
jgi:hypothetical protein